MIGSHRKTFIIKERKKKFDGEIWMSFEHYYKLRAIGVPDLCGVYVIMIKRGKRYIPVYIGRTTSFLRRISSHPKINDIFKLGG